MCLFCRGGPRLMQNKQTALFAGGNRVKCKVTSSGLEHKQSSVPAHLGSQYWTLGVNSASLPHLDWMLHLEDPFHCSHFLSFFWVRGSESNYTRAADGVATLRAWNPITCSLYPPSLPSHSLVQYFSSLLGKVISQLWMQTTAFVLTGGSLPRRACWLTTPRQFTSDLS